MKILNMSKLLKAKEIDLPEKIQDDLLGVVEENRERVLSDPRFKTFRSHIKNMKRMRKIKKKG